MKRNGDKMLRLQVTRSEFAKNGLGNTMRYGQGRNVATAAVPTRMTTRLLMDVPIADRRREERDMLMPFSNRDENWLNMVKSEGGSSGGYVGELESGGGGYDSESRYF